MTLEQEFIRFAMRYFPHVPHCGEHAPSGIGWGYARCTFTLIHKDQRYGIQCSCGERVDLPNNVDWPKFWELTWDNKVVQDIGEVEGLRLRVKELETAVRYGQAWANEKDPYKRAVMKLEDFAE